MLVLLRAPPLTLHIGHGTLIPAGPNARHTSHTQLYAGTLANPTHL